MVFYLAQTLDLVDDIPAALDMYKKRIDMGGWQQEIFEAHMRRVGPPLPLLLPCSLRALLASLQPSIRRVGASCSRPQDGLHGAHVDSTFVRKNRCLLLSGSLFTNVQCKMSVASRSKLRPAC